MHEPGVVQLAGFSEAVSGERLEGLQQSEVRWPARALLRHQHRFLHQADQEWRDSTTFRNNRCDVLGLKPTSENSEATKCCLFLWLEQAIAPVGQTFEAALATL